MLLIFSAFMRENWTFTKVGTCFAEKKSDDSLYLDKMQQNEGKGKAVEDFMRGQDISRRVCDQRVIPQEKSLYYL